MSAAHFVRMFMPQFAALVKSGVKLQTVRKIPKRMPKAGDKISLRAWSGLPYRSPQTVLAESEITKVETVTIDRDLLIVTPFCPRTRLSFAQADGFASWDELVAWFESTHALPFEGIVIYWKRPVQ